MYQALYRKWRPQSFADVIGQSAVTDTLTKQVETNRLSHAYLFAGSRGTGKTTCAKLLARAVNCENPFHGNPCNKCDACRGIADGSILDVVEIDAASNNGVDGVRDLREEAVYTPANVRRRVYIIDEVHMFSTGAFNALLKIMEEPPEHVMFILATTELHKVPATIASRCQRFTFKRIPSSKIAERLVFIARSEKAELTEEAAMYIASLSDGAMRDALSLLDQCMSLGGGNVDIGAVEEVVGLASRTQTLSLAEAVASRDTRAALILLSDIYKGGRNLTSVLTELSEILRDVLIMKTAENAEIPRIGARYADGELIPLCESFDTARLVYAIQTIQDTTSAIASSTNKRIDAELCCVRLCESIGGDDAASLAARMSELEKKLESGVTIVTPRPTPAPRPAPVEKKREPAPLPAVEKRVQKAPPKDDAALWKQILETAKSKLSPGVYPLFEGATASRDGNMLVISSANLFVMKMLMQKANMDILRAAAEETGSGVTIMATERTLDKPANSGMDELLSGLENKDGIIIK